MYKQLKQAFKNEMKRKDSDEYIFIETFYGYQLKKLPLKKLLNYYKKYHHKNVIKDLKKTISEIIINEWLDEFIKEKNEAYK